VTDLFTSIEGTTLAAWVRESPSIWAYATILTLHTVGLAIVVGANAVVDLRLLGWATAIPLTALRAVFPIMWAGFAINFTSGVLLFMADATTKSGQIVFYVKLACITLALLVARTISKRVGPAKAGHHIGSAEAGHHIGTAEAGHHIDSRVRALAVASLFLWAGAIVAGRLMAYL
jgi:hypothetical protein